MGKYSMNGQLGSMIPAGMSFVNSGTAGTGIEKEVLKKKKTQVCLCGFSMIRGTAASGQRTEWEPSSITAMMCREN